MVIDFTDAAFLVRQALRELSAQEVTLSANLQGLLPSNQKETSKSAQYLYESGLMLKELCEQISYLMLPSKALPQKRSSS